MFVQKPLTCVEICAGAGGQALGLAMAGFVHVALVEYEADYCNTLKQNRPEWNVICADVRNFNGKPYEGVDLLEVFNVRHFQLLENSWEKMMKEIYFLKHLG